MHQSALEYLIKADKQFNHYQHQPQQAMMIPIITMMVVIIKN
jgi:hypothetical protein